MTAFDYVFYKVAKFFYKRDGIEAARAQAIVTILQSFILIDVFGFILQTVVGLERLSEYVKYSTYIAAALTSVLFIFNHYRYKNKYWRFADKWRNKETTQQKISRICGVLLFVVFLIVVFLYLGTAAYRQ